MSYVDTATRIKGMLVEQDLKVTRKDGSEFLFRVRPVSAKEFAKMSRGKSQSSLKEDVGEGFGLMESTIVSCVVEPKIVSGDATSAGEGEVSIESFPMDLMNKLFEAIFKLSGLSSEEEEETKN